MPSISKVKKDILPLIKKAEKTRKAYRLCTTLSSLFVQILLLGFLCLPLLIFLKPKLDAFVPDIPQGNTLFSLQTFIITYWALFFFSMIKSIKLRNKYRNFEKRILTIFFKKLVPELQFIGTQQIKVEEIMDSKLIPVYGQVSKSKGAQQKIYNLNFGTLTGKIGQTSVLLGDVKILNQTLFSSFFMYIPLFNYLYITRNYLRPWFSKHHEPENIGSSFTGMFAVMDFNKKFRGSTVILPDQMEKTIGYMAKTFQSLNFKRDQLVNLEDPEFEEDFVVYSTDQVEARYILSPSLMKRISQLKKKINKPIMLSFNNNKLYLGVQHSHGFLSLNKKKCLISSDIFELLHEDVSAAIDIVEDLNLNSRIWKN